MRSYLVTGGSGFIGTHLVKHLLDDKSTKRIIILDRVQSSIRDSRVQFVQADITKSFDIPKPLQSYYLVHLAGLSKDPGYSWEDYFLVNFEGTKNVIAFAERKKIHHILFTSTMMVFRAGEQRYSEKDLQAPDTAYGISKLLAEQALITWCSKSGNRKLKILRPGVVFGKGENGNYLLLYRALKKNLFCYVGRRTTVKSSVYVKDLTKLIIHLANGSLPSQVYNVAIPTETTIQQIVETYCRVFGWRRLTPTVPYSLLLIFSYIFEALSHLGLRNNIHHRRIQKLYYSTNISSDLAVNDGFRFEYDIEHAIRDWKEDCGGNDLS